MRIVKRVFGVLLTLGALFAGFAGYMEAGGMHGWRSFAGRFPECLSRNDAPLAFTAMGVLLIAGVGLLIASRKRKTPPLHI